MKIYSVTNSLYGHKTRNDVNFKGNARNIVATAGKVGGAVLASSVVSHELSKQETLAQKEELAQHEMFVRQREEYIRTLEQLEKTGIKFLTTDDENNMFVGGLGYYFRLNIPTFSSDKKNIADILLYELTKENDRENSYGVKNFKKCMESLSRFDIVSEGLRLGNCKLQETTAKDRFKAAHDLTLNIKQPADKYIPGKQRKIHPVSSKELFILNDEAYYFDEAEKTVYSVRLTEKAITPKDITTCKFIFDEKNNLIGYNKTYCDYYSSLLKTKEYIEQNKPSIKMPSPDDVNVQDAEVMTQVYRFGNTPYRERMNDAFNNIQDFVNKKLDTTITKEDLQCVRYNKQGKDVQLLNYYSPKLGFSFVFDMKGKYLNTINYTKNEYGELTNYYLGLSKR